MKSPWLQISENRSELVAHKWTETTWAELLQWGHAAKTRVHCRRTNYKMKLTTRTWSQHRTISKPPQGRISRDTTVRYCSGNQGFLPKVSFEQHTIECWRKRERFVVAYTCQFYSSCKGNVAHLPKPSILCIKVTVNGYRSLKSISF